MNKKRTIGWVLALPLFFVVASCSTDYGIPEKKMVSILTEIHLADGTIANVQGELSIELMDSTQVYGFILKKYGYTVDEFRYSLNEYMKSPQVFDNIYDKVIGQLNDMQKQYAKLAGIKDTPDLPTVLEDLESYLRYETSIVGDTIKVWW